MTRVQIRLVLGALAMALIFVSIFYFLRRDNHERTDTRSFSDQSQTHLAHSVPEIRANPGPVVCSLCAAKREDLGEADVPLAIHLLPRSARVSRGDPVEVEVRICNRTERPILLAAPLGHDRLEYCPYVDFIIFDPDGEEVDIRDQARIAIRLTALNDVDVVDLPAHHSIDLFSLNSVRVNWFNSWRPDRRGVYTVQFSYDSTGIADWTWNGFVFGGDPDAAEQIVRKAISTFVLSDLVSIEVVP